MTWNTPAGKRILSKKEAKLFCDAVLTMLDFYNDWPEADLNYGYPLVLGEFQQLSTEKKLTVLEQVAIGLLTETAEIPEQTAINEAAIYFVYRFIHGQFAMDKDISWAEDIWGPAIIDARRAGMKARGEKYSRKEDRKYAPFVGCDDLDKWEMAITFIADCILWDRDWEMFIPDPMMKECMRIDDGYYCSFQGEASPGAQERLTQLCENTLKKYYPELNNAEEAAAFNETVEEGK